MDAISAAASIVGLLGAATKITMALASFVQNVKNAPKLAQSVLSEVTDFSACLSHLQRFIVGEQDLARSTEHLIMVDQIIVALSNGVLVFSDLERAVDGLKLDQPMRADRLAKWMLHEETISTLLARLQSSKLSLNLMLSTMSWWDPNTLT